MINSDRFASFCRTQALESMSWRCFPRTRALIHRDSTGKAEGNLVLGSDGIHLVAHGIMPSIRTSVSGNRGGGRFVLDEEYSTLRIVNGENSMEFPSRLICWAALLFRPFNSSQVGVCIRGITWFLGREGPTDACGGTPPPAPAVTQLRSKAENATSNEREHCNRGIEGLVRRSSRSP